ncbi:hypothetical protein PTH_0709 [Pelotomaculum thermopropionicum SI]|uniref:CRISPR-associated protein Csx11 n=1 Tax=Pelotomaculum thermopropionicum (strain DSM 13744 / JCM 10971 / SI) TaxID=370438 RepID=A5D4F9_PELTS|nr:hypothetical protein PTH_0709 [Pelotomaculum thermopropionicum SI]
MNSSFWRPDTNQKRAILFMEALGLIHDLGKLSDTFLQSQEPNSTLEYIHNLLVDPRQIDIYKNHRPIPNNKASSMIAEWLRDAGGKPAAFQERPDLTSLLLNLQFDDWTGTKYCLAELMPLVARPALARKTPSSEWGKVLGKEMTPGLLIGYLHGVAHFEKQGDPDDKNKQPYSAVFRATPFGLEDRIETGKNELTTTLKYLPLSNIEPITSNQRRDWLRAMEENMKRGLADTRRPHNEVSLWDWGYMTATLAKAAAAWIFKNGWPRDNDLGKIPYRTLCITLNRLVLYSRCDKIGDLLGVRQVLDEAYRKVQRLLEEEYALANRFYRDETGEYYLFPDLGYSNEEMIALREAIQAQFPPDLRPQVHLGEPVTAGQLDDSNPSAVRKLVAEPRGQSMQEHTMRAGNNLCLFEWEWGNGRPENAEICSACGVYPIGYPREGSSHDLERSLSYWATQAEAQRLQVCRVCLDRRRRRAEDWAKNNFQGTIWIDEVADDNGLVALFVGKFGLEGWLDGSLVSTIKVTHNEVKYPSPARLYRIVETCRSFWQQVTDDLTRKTVGQRPFRLALYPATNEVSKLGNFHAYELKADSIALSVIWDKSHRRFLTIENLTYLASRCRIPEDALMDKLRGNNLHVVEPSEFLSPARTSAKVRVERVDKLNGYTPTIPLLAEPSVYMAMVPAVKALELARNVKRKYEEEMGRVRDRLPIYLGLVFFRRHTPLRAVLEAGRAMLNMDGGDKWEGWRLVDKNLNNGVCELAFDNGITWKVPTVAGDGQTRDEWYPRMYEGDSRDSKKVKHVNDLRVRNPQIPPDKGWKVWVKPSRFDFEFLDTNSRRFEIYYDQNGRRPRRTRPFYLEDLDRLDTLWTLLKLKLPAKAQRYQVIRTIEDTRQKWYGRDREEDSWHDPVFQQFVADTLAQAAWPKTWKWTEIEQDPQKKQLIEAGVKGELADLAELYMEILKE